MDHPVLVLVLIIVVVFFVFVGVETDSLKERRDAVNEVRVLSSLKHPYIVSYC